LDDVCNMIADPSKDLEQQVENMALLEQAVNMATPREQEIISLLLGGAKICEAARVLKMSKNAAANCLGVFCSRARAAFT